MLRKMRAFLFILSAAAAADNTAPNYLGIAGPTCCIAPDGHGNYFVVVSRETDAGGVEVIALDSSGHLISSFIFDGGSDSIDIPAAAAVDSIGNLWVAGERVTTFNSGFLAKLDHTGTKLLGFESLGGRNLMGTTAIRAIAFDPAGNVYVTGSTNQADFPVTPGAFQNFGRTNGPNNIPLPTYTFIAKLQPGTQSLYSIVYATLLGGSQCVGDCTSIPDTGNADTTATAIVVDAWGIVTVAGVTNALDFPTTAGAFQTQCQCQGYQGSAFITQINADGSGLVWSTLLGSGLFAEAVPPLQEVWLTGLALDASGNAIVTGMTWALDFPTTPGALQTHLPPLSPGEASSSGFVTKVNSTGTQLLFSTYIGGAVLNQLSTFRLDQQGNIWISGTVYDSTGFPTQAKYTGAGNSFIAALAADGSSLLLYELLPNGILGVDLALTPDDGLIALGEQDVVLFPPAALAGFTVLGVADSAGTVPTQTVAPGEYVSIYGTGLGPSPAVGAYLDASGTVAGDIAGTKVYFEGIIAPLLYVSANQINALVPYEIAGHGQIDMQVVSSQRISQNLALNVVVSQPYVFAILNPDGSVNSTSNRAAPGSTVSLYVSGAGALAVNLPDGAIATTADSTPASPVQVIVNSATQTTVPSSAQSVPGQPVNLLLVNVDLPSGVTSSTQFVLQIGPGLSSPFSIYLQ